MNVTATTNMTGARQSGFTLLEVMAAFVVFALIFATALQVMSGAMRNTVKSDQYTQAALWAQSRMDLVGIDPPVEDGSWSGEFDDEYSWEITIVPWESESDTYVAEEFLVDLYEVILTVNWGENQGTPKQAKFRTLRSAPVQR